MKISIVAVALIFFTSLCSAQDYALMDSLKQQLEEAKTPFEKVTALGQLSGIYLNLDNELAERYTKQLLEVAELSRDRELMIRALLMLANSNYNNGGVQERLNKAKHYSQQAFDLARANSLDEYMAWGYIYLARGARNEGEFDKALNYDNLAISVASGLDKHDSLKIYAFNSLGNTYMTRREKLLAFRNFLQAINLAESFSDYESLGMCYYNMSSFYADLENYEKAKDYLFKVQELTKKYKKPYDRLDVYLQLGRVYVKNKQFDMAAGFYEKGIKLADTLRFEVFKINVYANIIEMHFSNNQPQKALNYFKEKRELTDFITKAGLSFYLHQIYANGYSAIGKYDSATYYFKLSEREIEKKANRQNQYWFYTSYADLFTKTGQHKKALEYWNKAKKIGEERGDIVMLKKVSQELDSVYQNLGDYKSAYAFNNLYNHYKDSLEQLSTEKDLLRLEVENENKRKEREQVLAQDQKRERHNIQYMGITAGITGVFIMLVMMGAFSVSKTTIRILGFFAFIFLFEFIILLADNEIHHWTHGEPWKILAIKIALISILLPLHHFLEEKVIHYLTSRKLMELKTKGLFQKISGKSETVS